MEKNTGVLSEKKKGQKNIPCPDPESPTLKKEEAKNTNAD